MSREIVIRHKWWLIGAGLLFLSQCIDMATWGSEVFRNNSGSLTIISTLVRVVAAFLATVFAKERALYYGLSLAIVDASYVVLLDPIWSIFIGPGHDIRVWDAFIITLVFSLAYCAVGTILGLVARWKH
jgi:hypothetical protein